MEDPQFLIDDESLLRCQKEHRESLSWHEKHESPDYFYDYNRSAYWNYVLVACCATCKTVVFKTGGRRNGPVGNRREGWFSSSSSVEIAGR